MSSKIFWMIWQQRKNIFVEYLNLKNFSEIAAQVWLYTKVRSFFCSDWLNDISYKYCHFAGFLRPIKKDVAMKFTRSDDNEDIANEYKMYTYLNAINNSTVESYGIPSVYFYGSWRDYVLMAISLIDPNFNNNYRFYDVDILIVFREFVSHTVSPTQIYIFLKFLLIICLQLRISKYIHSRGIHHNDISLSNFMFRRDRGFIVGLCKLFSDSRFIR